MYTKRYLLLAILLPVLLLPVISEGQTRAQKPRPGSRAGSEEGIKMVRRYHLHMPDKTTESTFMELMRDKGKFNTELEVLSQLAREKKEQYAELQDALFNTFDIVPEIKYEYDREDRAIYELVPSASTLKINAESSPGAPPSEYRKTLLKKLDSDREAAQFVRLAASKQQTYEAMVVFNREVEERKNALERVDEKLQGKFQLKPKGMYKYDEEEMILYEILPASEVDADKIKDLKTKR